MSEKTESEWVMLVRERYEPAPEVKMSYKDENALLLLLNAPEQYEIEHEMLKYAKEHENATMEEMVDFFRDIVPEGLPPCASEWDDED